MTVLKRREEFKEKRINRKNRAKSRDNFLLRISHGINPSFKWYTKKFLFPSAKLIKKKKKKERIKESSSLGSDASSSIVF